MQQSNMEEYPMINKPLGTNIVTQVAFTVHDIEKSAADFADFLGVPKPVIKMTGSIEESQGVYRGAPMPSRAKLAFFDVGENLRIELIQPDEKPSIWRELLDKNGEGFHHIAFVIKGMREKLAVLDKAGMPLVQKGEYKGGRYAYVDALGQLKTIIELLEND
jgi:methylmalonyl-CoA/ethylmalonyl-CoA epimerase